jgi:hypothetical protein
MLSMRDFSATKSVMIAMLLLLAAGCGSELETGYKPQKIGVSDEERRAYYAAPFSPDAMGVEEAKMNLSRARRPYQ